MGSIWKRNYRVPVSSPNLGRLERRRLIEAFDSGWIAKGECLEKFEEEFAKYVGVKYAVVCSSGTAALHLAYESIKKQVAERALVPALTFVATGNTALQAGYAIRVVDVDPKTWNMSTKNLEKEDFNVIVPVHLYGNPCNMDKIMEIAVRKDAYIIEDAAQALGSTYMGNRCGSLGHVSIFSFFANKVITTGEGGMLCTNRHEIAQTARSLRNHRMVDGYDHEGLGYNYRMTNLQAAIGLAQLARLPDFLRKKRKIAKFYRENLNSRMFTFQKIEDGGSSNYWMFTVLINEKEQFMEHMKLNGIETKSVFKPLNQLIHLFGDQLYAAKNIYDHGVTLPTGTTLTKSELEYIVRTANAFRPVQEL